MDKRTCPHCGHHITIKEAILILRAAAYGFAEYVFVRDKSSNIEGFVEIGEANPFATEILSEDR